MKVPRRSIVKAVGTVGLAGLAGCSQSRDSESAGMSDGTDTATVTEEASTTTTTAPGEPTTTETPPPSGQSAAWPQFHYNAAKTGYAPDATGPTSDPQVKWISKLVTGAEVGGPKGAPVVADGTVFVNIGRALHALDIETGESQWSVEGNFTSTYQSPAVADGVVYIASDTLYALDASTGDEQWTYELPETVDSSFVHSPTIKDGSVYLAASGVHAVDAATGEQLWSTGLSTGTTAQTTVTAADGLIYFGIGTDIMALDAETGEQAWTFGPGGRVYGEPTRVAGTPTVHEDNVYVAINIGQVSATSNQGIGRLFKVDVSSGEEVWMFEDKKLQFTASPTVMDGTVYGATESLYAIDISSGEEQWTAETGDLHSRPIVAGETIYFGASDKAFAYDIDGNKLWGFDFEKTNEAVVTKSLAAVDGVLYVGGNRWLYALAEG